MTQVILRTAFPIFHPVVSDHSLMLRALRVNIVRKLQAAMYGGSTWGRNRTPQPNGSTQ